MSNLHLAAAGGGSAGFHGGGGGGGRGAGLYFLLQILIRIAILGHGLGALVLIGLIVIWLLFAKVAPAMRSAAADQRGQGRRRRAKRERRVELAAAEAAEDDPDFAPDVVRPAAARLFTSIQLAWDRRDRVALRRYVAPGLLNEWERRLDDFDRRGWRNRVQPLGEPAVEYVGIAHRGDAKQDRVTVRIEAKLRDYVEDSYGSRIKRAGRLTETVKTREFWTLAKDANNRWILVSIEQGAEGAHALSDQVVATPWSDEPGLRDQALVEQAVADAAPAHVAIGELADLDYEGDARAAALDLSLADARFAPDVLEIAARQAVSAWAEAVDGDGSALTRIASPQATQQLLHPGDPSGRTRLVVRGPVVRRIAIAALDAAAQPPAMTIDVEIEGRRYLQDRDTTAVLAGNPNQPTRFTERWTLTLDGDSERPWRIAGVNTAAIA